MGNPLLRFCSGLTIFLALSHAAVIKPTVKHHVLEDPEHLCPCIEKEVCPRVWGTAPEDALLGNFSPCKKEGLVRCCGIKEHDSEERSIESLDEELKDNGGGAKTQARQVMPPGVVVPVPFLFPEYPDHRKSTTPEPPSVEEAAESEESDEWVYVDDLSEEDVEPMLVQLDEIGGFPPLEPEVDEAKGKNIANRVSQTGNFASSNSLDYRGVDKLSVTEGGAGSTGRGGTSSGNKRYDDKKATPSVVQLGDTKEAEVEADGNKKLSAVTTTFGTIESSKTSEASLNRENKDTLEATDFAYELTDSGDPRSKNKGKRTVTREETSSQNKTQKVINESSNYNEKTSSFTTVYDEDDDGDEYDEAYESVVATEAAPTVKIIELADANESRGRRGNRGRKAVSTQEKSESSKKESSKIEENSSSSVKKTVSEAGTVSEQKSETAKKEASNFEESKSSKVEKVVTNAAGRESGKNFNSEILDASASQAPNFEQPQPSRRPAYRQKGKNTRGNRQETTVEQKSESSKKESSTVEESKSSSVETSSTNVEKNSGVGSRGKIVEKIEKNTKESSSSEKNSSSSSKTSKTEEATIEGGFSKVVSKEEKKESSASSEKSESTKEESLIVEKESSLDFKGPSVIEVETTPSSIIPGRGTGRRPGFNTQKPVPIPSGDSSLSTGSSSTERPAPGSNLMDMLVGKLPPKTRPTLKPNKDENLDKIPWKENENTSGMIVGPDTNVWHVDNRPYIPVLINAGFLKDRPTSTGLVGLDPLSGVTHSDIGNPDVAPELLPLSCGNVIFGERFRNGKTLVCEIPQLNGSPARFFKEDVNPVSQGKLHGPPLPGAILPAGILDSSDGVTDTLKSAAITTGENNSRRPMRKRVLAKRPVPIAPAEVLREEEISISEPTRVQVDRRRSRQNSRTGKQFETNVNRENDRAVEAAVEIGSRKTTRESISASASSLLNSMLSQESVSTSGRPTETTKAEFEITSEELAKADREAAELNSKFYLLPLAPVLPSRPKSSRSSKAENPTTSTDTTSLPAAEPATVVEVTSASRPERTRVGRRRQRVLSGKKLPSSDPQETKIQTLNAEENQLFVSDELTGRPTGVYNQRKRGVTTRSTPAGIRSRRDVISADKISPSGRVPIVGPIPKATFHPIEGDELLVELPDQNSSPKDFHSPNAEVRQK